MDSEQEGTKISKCGTVPLTVENRTKVVQLWNLYHEWTAYREVQNEETFH